MGGLTSWRDDACITRPAVDLRRAVQLVTNEPPQQPRPREDGREQTLDGALAATCAGPAGEAQHGDASGQHQQGKRDPTQAAVGRRRDRGSEALEKGDHVPHGLLRR